MTDNDLEPLKFAALPDPPESAPAPALTIQERFQANVERYNALVGFSHAADLRERPTFNPLPEPHASPAQPQAISQLPADSPPAPPAPAFQPLAAPQASQPPARLPALPQERRAEQAAFGPLPDAGPRQDAPQATETTSEGRGELGGRTGGERESRELLDAIRELTAVLRRLQEGTQFAGTSGGGAERKPGIQADGSFVPAGSGTPHGGTTQPRQGAYPRARDQVGPSTWRRVMDNARPR